MSDRGARTWRELFVESFMGAAPRDLLDWALPRMTSAMREVRLRPGELAFREGDPSRFFYFVVSGRMRLEARGLPAWTFGERSVIGIVDALLDRPRARDAVAETPAQLLELPSDAWFELLEDSIEMSLRSIEAPAAGVHALRLRAAPLLADEIDDSPPPSAAPIPRSLRLVDRISLLRRVPALGYAGVQSLASLASVAEERQLDGGAMLFPAGDADRALYVVSHGEIETTRSDPALRDRFARTSLVAGAAALVDRSAYRAVATRASLVLRIDHEDWVDVMEEHFAVVRSISRWLAQEREHLLNLVASLEGADAPNAVPDSTPAKLAS